MAWFKFKEHRVWYERQGSGDPIVFLPNATLDGRLWEHQAERFKDRYDVIVVDLPGFGRSDRLTPSLDLWVRWLGRFIDEMQLAPVTLVGNCMGSLTALTYAADHPDKVNALVLFNTLDKDVDAAGPMGAGTGILKARAFRPVIEAMVRHGGFLDRAAVHIGVAPRARWPLDLLVDGGGAGELQPVRGRDDHAYGAVANRGLLDR